MDIVKPVSLIEKDSCYILDMGQNMVGWLKINIKGQQPGDTLTMRFAEILQSDTTLLLANLRRAEVTDFYVASDNKPIGIILCKSKKEVAMEYALGGLSNNVFASTYTSYIPNKEELISEVEKVLTENKT